MKYNYEEIRHSEMACKNTNGWRYTTDCVTVYDHETQNCHVIAWMWSESFFHGALRGQPLKKKNKRITKRASFCILSHLIYQNLPILLLTWTRRETKRSWERKYIKGSEAPFICSRVPETTLRNVYMKFSICWPSFGQVTYLTIWRTTGKNSC